MSAPTEGSFLDGLRAAKGIVERQTNLPDLIHFERPSDFRKGVLTSIMALEAAIAEEIAKGGLT